MEDLPSPLADSQRCLNCNDRLQGRFCANCGQQAKELRRPFFRLFNEGLRSLFELDGRAYRSLFYLLTKPAYLSQEYFSGRRTSYTPPLRMFLVISVSFFLLLSFYTSIQSIAAALNNSADPSAEQASFVEGPAVENSVIEINDSTGRLEKRQAMGDGNGLKNLLIFVDQINFSFFTQQTNANLRRVMRAQAETNFNTLVEDPVEFGRQYLEYITLFMLLMMPLLALIQKIMYLRTGHFYVEHLVLTLHNHSFIIFCVFLSSIADLVAENQFPLISSLFKYMGTAIYIWIWIYLYLSLKNYFQQGYGLTLLKFFTTTILYGLTLSSGVFISSIILFFLF